MRLSAKEVQDILGVKDCEVIAHGYTFDRQTLDVWFEYERLIRVESNYYGQETKRMESDDFDPFLFRCDVKRWYMGTEERGFNRRLLSLFYTFGDAPSMTNGGTYPDRPPS